MSQTRAQLVQGFSNTSASADVITVDSSANVGINKTSPVKDLDVTGEIRASTGILFGTDTAAANTLDDYEEGTWTPTFFGETTAGTYTFSHESWYIKVGQMVTVNTVLTNVTTVSTGSGHLRMGGLPFTGVSTSQVGSVLLDDFTLDSNTRSLAATLVTGTKISVRQTRTGTSDLNLPVTSKDSNNSDVFLCITYKAA